MKLNSIKNATRTTPRIGGIQATFGETDPNISNTIKTKLLKTRNKAAVVDFIPKYLHNSVEIIEVLYDLLDLRDYSPSAYLQIVQNVDVLLKIQEDAQLNLDQCTENLDVAKDHSNLALNNLQSFVYSIPSNRVVNTKLSMNLKRLQLLLLRITDSIYRKCKEQDSNLNTYRKPANVNGFYTGPRGNDSGLPYFNLNFNIFN